MRRVLSVPTISKDTFPSERDKKKYAGLLSANTKSIKKESNTKNATRSQDNSSTPSPTNISPISDINGLNVSRASSAELTFDDYQNFEYFEATESPVSPGTENYKGTSDGASAAGNKKAGTILEHRNGTKVINGNAVSDNRSSLRVHTLSGKLRQYESPKLTEVYGFVGWMISWFALLIFLLWAFFPEQYWNNVGVTYYPNRYWALAIPAYLIMSYLFLCVIHVGIALMHTPAFSSASLISDEFTREPRDFARLAKSSKSIVGTPEIYDIPLSVTNRLLYSRHGKNEGTYKNTRYRYRFGQSRGVMSTSKVASVKNEKKHVVSVFPASLQRIKSLPTR
eukprot:g13939.t1